MEVINYFKSKEGRGFREHVGTHESGDYVFRHLFATGEGFRANKYDTDKEWEIVDKSEIDALERMTCGRRGETPFTGKDQNADYWRTKPNGDRTCSFCGSMHPMDVIKAIEEDGFGVIGGTDKSYKWYVRRPNVQNASEGGIKYYKQHDTPEFIDRYTSLVSAINVNNK